MTRLEKRLAALELAREKILAMVTQEQYEAAKARSSARTYILLQEICWRTLPKFRPQVLPKAYLQAKGLVGDNTPEQRKADQAIIRSWRTNPPPLLKL